MTPVSVNNEFTAILLKDKDKTRWENLIFSNFVDHARKNNSGYWQQQNKSASPELQLQDGLKIDVHQWH